MTERLRTVVRNRRCELETGVKVSSVRNEVRGYQNGVCERARYLDPGARCFEGPYFLQLLGLFDADYNHSILSRNVITNLQADTMHHPRRLESFFHMTENTSQCALTSKSCLCINISVFTLLIFARKTRKLRYHNCYDFSEISKKKSQQFIEITNINKCQNSYMFRYFKDNFQGVFYIN